MADLSHPAREVYMHDRDRFLASLFVPEPERQELLAVVALNVELARVRNMVSEEMIAHIRFAWWQEALEDIYAGKPARGQPVLEALKPVTVHVPKESLLELVQTYRENFPELPSDVDSKLEAISLHMLRSLCPEAEVGWREAQGIIARHRKRFGARNNGWLGVRLLAASIF